MSGFRKATRRALRVTLAAAAAALIGFGAIFAVSVSRLFETFGTTASAAFCAGAFITGREPARVDAETFSKEPPRDRIYRWLSHTLDRERRRVTVHAWPNADIHAVHVEGRGCVLVPPGVDPATIPPATQDLASRPALRHEAMTVVTRAAPLPGVDEARLDAAVAAMFEHERHRTHSVLIYRNGTLVREAYAQGAGPQIASESWSLGKTLVGALAGTLVMEGRLGLDETLDLPHWPAGDPRRAIRVRDVMGMAGGLAFTTEFETWPLFRQSDHGKVYHNLPEIVAFVAGHPAAHPPGTRGNYNNADPILLMAHIRHKLGLDAAGLRALIEARVLKPLGMANTVLSTDYAGTPIMTGYVYAPARDWGNLGLLFLQKGEFEGRRLFGADFAEFVARPAAGYPQEAYGGLIWLNRTRYYSAPESALVMSGAGDQIVLVDRQNGLVIVRMGHSNKSRDAFPRINASLGEIYASFGITVEPGRGGR